MSILKKHIYKDSWQFHCLSRLFRSEVSRKRRKNETQGYPTLWTFFYPDGHTFGGVSLLNGQLV